MSFNVMNPGFIEDAPSRDNSIVAKYVPPHARQGAPKSQGVPYPPNVGQPGRLARLYDNAKEELSKLRAKWAAAKRAMHNARAYLKRRLAREIKLNMPFVVEQRRPRSPSPPPPPLPPRPKMGSLNPGVNYSSSSVSELHALRSQISRNPGLSEREKKIRRGEVAVNIGAPSAPFWATNFGTPEEIRSRDALKRQGALRRHRR